MIIDLLRRWCLALIVLLALGIGASSMAADESVHESSPSITVYKSPTCGCCVAWAEYLVDNGFVVTVLDHHDMAQVKMQHGIPSQLQSCHTAVVGDYVVEGHVPADDIWRLLRERPAAAGLTAPGMPLMSPGMNSIEPIGYDVLLLGTDEQISVYSRY